MTNDERTQTWANGMMRLAFPDLAYSYVEFPLDLDPAWVLGQMNAALDAYRATFPPPDVEAQAGPRVGIQAMARPSSNVPQRQQTAQAGAQGGNQYGVAFVCPEHGEPLAPSVRNKNMDFVEELGRELPASWFHTSEGKSCSKYLSAIRYQLQPT